MKKWLIILMALLMAIPVGLASGMPDDDNKDPSIRPGIRRLHPERERAKAIKKLQEQMSRKAEVKDDPWDTSDEVWGTVDLPPVAVKDSGAVVGRRLTSPAEGLSSYRLVWRDEPMTETIEQLMPFMVMNEDGLCRSKYVTADSLANEVYFAFDVDLEVDSMPGPLRLCVSYCGDTPMDYDQLVFTVNGFDYTFYPLETRHGVAGGGLYWAASDDELHPAYRDLVYALAHGEWAMIKLQGGGVSRVKVLNNGQLEDFANTLALYRLLGGTL